MRKMSRVKFYHELLPSIWPNFEFDAHHVPKIFVRIARLSLTIWEGLVRRQPISRQLLSVVSVGNS